MSDLTESRETMPSPEVLEQVMVKGDLRSLSPGQKAIYYTKVCESMGLSPLTKPLEYIFLNGKEVLYVTRAGTDQLRKLGKVSIEITKRETIEGVHIVTAKATLPDGRSDESTGAVSIQGLRGDALANCVMKAETKAKRRVTLSIIGLGWLDESEVEGIRDMSTPVNAALDSQGSIPGDSLDPNDPIPQTLTVSYSKRNPSEAQLKRLYAIVSANAAKGWNHERAKEYITKRFGVESSKELTIAQYEDVCAVFQTLPYDTNFGTSL